MADSTIKVKKLNNFPTMIFQMDIEAPKPLNDRLMDSIYAEQESDDQGVNKSNTAEFGSWHSKTNMHKQKEYQEFLGHIHYATDSLSNELGYASDHKIRVSSMWSIIGPPGNGNRSHIHPGCLWSGVYYVQTPEGSGQIEFTDPRTIVLMNQPKFISGKKRPRDCWTKVTFKPIAGRMLIFPAWLYHGVMPNMSKLKTRDGHRVIMSFNMIQNKKK